MHEISTSFVISQVLLAFFVQLCWNRKGGNLWWAEQRSLGGATITSNALLSLSDTNSRALILCNSLDQFNFFKIVNPCPHTVTTSSVKTITAGQGIVQEWPLRTLHASRWISYNLPELPEPEDNRGLLARLNPLHLGLDVDSISCCGASVAILTCLIFLCSRMQVPWSNICRRSRVQSGWRWLHHLCVQGRYQPWPLCSLLLLPSTIIAKQNLHVQKQYARGYKLGGGLLL